MASPTFFYGTRNCLEGYNFTEWPDLSADRSPSNYPQKTSMYIPSVDYCPGDGTFKNSLFLVAIARAIGAYCGTSDVLLAIQTSHDNSTGLLRITWDPETLWGELIHEVDTIIHGEHKHPTSIAAVRETLSLADYQHPCIALCHFDQANSQGTGDYPTVFSFNHASSSLELLSSTSTMHSTVSTQILAQISDLIRNASQHPSAKVSATPDFSPELLSVFEKGSDEDVVAAYPHLSPVNFAPEYLTQRSHDMPQETALRWYSNLSVDSPELSFESISYLEFHKKSNQIARWLISLGLEQEGRVAVCLERNLVFHTVMIGIMRAGGCYVPIDPELPLERKKYIAKNSGAQYVLTSSDITTADLFGSATIYIEDSSVQLEIACKGDEDIECIHPDSLAYLLYTSGTTGNPKGCLLTHRGLSQAILALSSTAANVYMNDIKEGRYLAVASIAFDVHLAETFVPLALGMPLLSAQRSQLLESLPTYVNKLAVTHLGIVPTLIEATLNAAQEVEGTMALRYIASGGEKMSESILEKWANHPQVRLANFYGPSEVTIGCCARFMTSSTPRANIGRPLANVSAYVVDSEMNILLRGSVGELVVEGPLVGRGYHERPDLTERVFVEWPRKGCWAYRTGDLVRMMPDSTLEILGRIDTQIKLRGVRIEAEGICAIIRKAIPQTASFSLDVATILGKHPAINVEQLVSFFSWEKDIPVSSRTSTRPYISIPPRRLMDQVKAKCEAELPSYMRPSHFIPLGWLPLSSNGKTDEKLLGQIFRDLDVETITGLSGSHEDKASRSCTSLEMEVFNVLQKHVALRFNNPHSDMNIFEAGLDSMGVIRFSTELRKKFRVTIPASDIMKNPRLSAIAAYLVCEYPRPQFPFETFTSFSNLDLPYDSNAIEEVLPAFSVQEGVLARSADQDTLYVQHVIISCKEHTSLPKLKLAWIAVVQRHQILRTVFHFGRDLLQIVLRPGSAQINWKHEEGIKCSKETFGKSFREQKALDIAREINLNVSSTPPYRLSVYIIQGHHFLVLSIHHALFDGISLPKFFSELEREYLSFTYSGELAVASDILRQISNIDFDNAERFWKSQFKGFSWPQTMLTPALPWRIHHHETPFKTSISSLKKLASFHGITLQALLTCAFAYILARDIYKQEDVVFGVIRSGRLLAVEHVEDALLPLVSVVPMRVNFGQQNSLSDIQLNISSTIEYEHVPLGKVQAWIRPGKSLFEALFSISINEPPKNDLWLSVESEPPEADYPLAVEIVLDTRRDAVLLRAAFAGQDQDQILFTCLQDFEGVVHRLAKDPVTYLSQPIDTVLNHLEFFEPEDSAMQGDDGAQVDPTALVTLRMVVANFLEFDPSLLAPSTSFFSMGLDSIKSVGLAKSLKNAGFSITSTELLRNSTLKALARCLELKKPSNQDDSEVEKNFAGLSREVVAEVDKQSMRLGMDDHVLFYPTTALQTGMLSQTVGSQGALYVHTFPVLVPGPIDLNRMHDAWNKAVRAHAILRTTFHFATEAGVWVQAVHTAETLDWAVISTETPESYAKALRRFISAINLEDETSFGNPPLWVRLFCSGAESGANDPARLVFIMHHALYDGISVGLLLDSVAAFYAGIPHRPVKQFHELLPHFIHQEKEGTTFWLGKLRAFNPTPLKRLHPSTPSKPATIEKVVLLNATQLNFVLNRAAVTMQCIGQAACAKLLSKYTCSHDVVFGHTVSGRNVAGTEEVLGPILNTIPCCVRLHKDMRNIELLRSIQQGNIDALPWQQASPRAIQKLMGLGNLWDTLFLFQPLQTANSPSIQGLDWRFDEVSTLEASIQYPLNIEMHHYTFGIVLKCASQSSYLEKEDLETMATHLQRFIEEILGNPDGLVFDESQEFQEVTPRDDAELCSDDFNTTPQLAFPSGSFDMSVHQTILTTVTGASASVVKPGTPLAALGIDSIIAIQIVGKYRQAGMKLSASDVIKSRTIGEMLSKISQSGEALAQGRRNNGYVVEGPELASIQGQFDAAEIEGISRVSSGMKWLIGAWQRSRGTRFQHVFAFQLPLNIDITKLRSAWFSLLDRHSILRSTFACASGHSEPRLVTFKVAAVQSWSEEYAADESSSSFGFLFAKMKLLVSAPLSTNVAQARALVVSSSHRSYLILHLHHFQYDAWSLQLLARELECLYNTTLSAEISNDMHPFLDYYSPNPHHLAEQKKYWQDRFSSSFQPVMFPVLNTNLRTSHATERLIRTNDACLPHASSCEQSARRLGVSLQSIFLACWASVQAKITSCCSSTFGLWHSGRTGSLDNLATLAIPCMNVLPMLVLGLEDTSILEIAKAIQMDLQQRTHVVEQSDQVQVNEWVGAGDKPMCNVFVNIIKVAPVLSIQDGILKPIHAPYIVPNHGILEETSIGLPITQLIKDDIMVDIATIGETDSVTMSIDSAAHMMDASQADELMSRWAREVTVALGICGQ